MSKARILIVDDEISNRVLLQEMLENYTVLEAHDGTSMWNVLDTHAIDLILLDVMMPHEDGFSLGKKITAHPKYNAIPIMYVTAKVSSNDIHEGFNSGAYDYIKKPFNTVELENRVKKALENSKHTNSLKTKAISADMVFEQIRDGILITDSQFIITKANPACTSLLGYTTENLKGTLISDIIFDEHKQPLGIHKLLNKKTQVWIQNDLGLLLPVQISISVMNDEFENELGWICVLQDFQKQIEIEQNLIQAKNDAEEASKIKSIFLASMSHEIRTPLNAILGFSDLLDSEESDTESKKRYIEIIKKNGEKLLSFIENLLDISSIEAQKTHIKKTSCNIYDILYDLHQEFLIVQPKYSDKKVQLSCIPSIPKDFTFTTDKNRLHQILHNLLENACKFTPEGEIVFGCSIQENNTILEFFVRDTGIGIDKDQQTNIFTAFQKVKDAQIQYSSGIGLGLSISENLVRLLNGTITLESEIHKGTTFTIRFPLQN